MKRVAKKKCDGGRMEQKKNCNHTSIISEKSNQLKLLVSSNIYYHQSINNNNN